MEKLTRVKALEICRDLWDYLAETGSYDKNDWPGWREHGRMRHACPCCEYAKMDCSFCLFLGCWRNTDFSTPCCDLVSPFRKWCDVRTPKTRKKYAKIIADFARAELAKENV